MDRRQAVPLSSSVVTETVMPSDGIFGLRPDVGLKLHAGANPSISTGGQCDGRWTVQILFRSANNAADGHGHERVSVLL
jgi:hypothetical protein